MRGAPLLLEMIAAAATAAGPLPANATTGTAEQLMVDEGPISCNRRVGAGYRPESTKFRH